VLYFFIFLEFGVTGFNFVVDLAIYTWTAKKSHATIAARASL
jgi:hypothetical protein